MWLCPGIDAFIEERLFRFYTSMYCGMDMYLWGVHKAAARKQCGRPGGCKFHYYPELLPYTLICM